MMEHFFGTFEECTGAIATIDTNAGWPSGGTKTWAVPQETTMEGIWAFPVPARPHGKPVEQLIAGVTLPRSFEIEFPAPEE